MLNPKDWKVLTALSGVYVRLGAAEMAARTLQQAEKLNPDEPGILITLGEILRETREYELATAAYYKAWQKRPDIDVALFGYGVCSSFIGELQNAVSAFEGLIDRGSRSIGVLFSLSNLPPPLINSDVLSLLASARPNEGQTAADFESSVAFTRGLALDRAHQYKTAWQVFLNANHAIYQESIQQYRRERKTLQAILERTRNLSTSQLTCEPEVFRGKPLSLLILGPSRSGKTTAERLMSALPGVKRGYENPIIENAVRRTFQTAGLITRDRINELPLNLNDLFRDLFLQEMGDRAPAASVFTNTHQFRLSF